MVVSDRKVKITNLVIWHHIWCLAMLTVFEQCRLTFHLQLQLLDVAFPILQEIPASLLLSVPPAPSLWCELDFFGRGLQEDLQVGPPHPPKTLPMGEPPPNEQPGQQQQQQHRSQ